MAAMGNALRTASLPKSARAEGRHIARCCRPLRSLILLLVDQAVDSRELSACILEFALGAERVGLVEKLVDLLLIGIAQRIGVDLGLHGFVGARYLIAALVVSRFFINGVGGPPHKADHSDANHATLQHSLPPSKFLKSLNLAGVKVAFDYGSSLRPAGWK